MENNFVDKIYLQSKSLILFLCLLYISTRLPFLLQIPIFVDEAGHIDLARKSAAMGGRIMSGVDLGKNLNLPLYKVIH